MGQFKRIATEDAEYLRLAEYRRLRRKQILTSGACLVHFISRQDLGTLLHIFSEPKQQQNAPGNYGLGWVAPAWLEVMAQNCIVLRQ